MMRLAPVVLLLAARGQDSGAPVVLAWKFAKGDVLDVSWKMDLKVAMRGGGEDLPGTDVTMDLSGALEVSETDAEGAECLLRVTRYAMSGRFGGKEVDLLIEDGKIKSDKMAGLENPGALDAAPLKIRAVRRGRFEAVTGNLLSTVFGGRGTMFGPELPEGAVKAGDTWKGMMQTGQARARNGPEFTVQYLLAGSASRDGRPHARITLDEEQSLKQGAMETKFRLQSESLFDVQNGRCAASRSTIQGAGAGEQGGKAFTLDFSAHVEFACSARAP